MHQTERALPMRFLSMLAVLMLAYPAAAHDLWLQPERFGIAQDGPLPVTIHVGHGGDKNRWGVSTSHIKTFETVTGEGRRDQHATLSLGSGEHDAAPSVAAGATQVLAMTSDQSISILDADAFNAYVEKEGILPIAQTREKNGHADQPGRELYSRRAKALISACSGGTAVSGDVVTEPVGHTLELVPLTDPSALAAGEELPVRVFYAGEPLQGALLKLSDLAADEAGVSEVRSGKDGTARLTVRAEGPWLLTAIWSRPLQYDRRADFETVFASLSFHTEPCQQERRGS